MRRNQERGFTLVEIAIVLVVVGLVLGGMVIGGNVLIDRARMASLFSKIKDLGEASRTFKTQYGYFPGDLPTAATQITGVSAGCSYAAGGAVGNGIVNTATESTCALEHLVRAGLLSKLDFNAATSVFFIDSDFGAGQVSLWFNAATNENMVRVTLVPCSIAMEIDSKLDNQEANPLAGGVVVGQDGTPAPINTCATGGANDPVATLLVRY